MTIMRYRGATIRSALAVLALTASVASAADLSDGPAGRAPMPDRGAAGRTSGGAGGPLTIATRDVIDVKLGYATLLKTEVVPTSIVLGSEEVVDVAPVGEMLILTGKTLGSTNLYLLDANKTVLLAAVVNVVPAAAAAPMVRVFQGRNAPLDYVCDGNACAAVTDAAGGIAAVVTPPAVPAAPPAAGAAVAIGQPGGVPAQ
ncbi:pilus assembly protein N-terminal domain-containing protein [Aurantimonas sp. HBX-1]|uniref:pilus assembly protein N-terminal domain-containing protein n=1 Tax=Aurantimonas sp. HBX-1 TaxID=2906072 RepID=UPI001F234B3D|nr:pilus assembly protein N-terminal domain-containing protein [Aurantimonas sp. HBX-1]UIJ70490.1 pilus assembly protein N-terminal domain-containing protein [Aurantimonas sp. HBX-1]